jgi:UDPglucose 6-dehydrogenase
MEKLIGFIGQGWIGKNYADDFEKRGYEVVRYSLEEPYVRNREKIKDCDIVFIAVPTPTSPRGFDDSILRKAIKEVGKGKIAVIKSTILPGTTESIQAENREIFVVHSPEFLSEASAAYDAANPNRNIVGIPNLDETYRKKAKEVMGVLPFAPFSLVCFSREAELIKYAGNGLLTLKVVFINLLYDIADNLGCKWENVRDAIGADPRLGSTHLQPVHQTGRGAGGHCFIKDFAALARLYRELVGDKEGLDFLNSAADKNNDLLLKSGKDLDLLAGVYGEEILKRNKS